MARRVMVLGVEPSASHLKGADVGALYGLSFDAWSDGMTGIDSTSLYALSVQGFMARTGASLEDFAEIAVRNRANARENSNAHLPLDITLKDVADFACGCLPLPQAGLLTLERWGCGDNSRAR